MTLDEAKGAAIAMHRSKNIGDKRTPDQWIDAECSSSWNSRPTAKWAC